MESASTPAQLSLADNIAAYESMENKLKRKAWGQHVVFYNGQILMNGQQYGFVDFQHAIDAASMASTSAMLSGALLIRKVGEEFYMRPGGRPTSFLPPKPSFWSLLRDQFTRRRSAQTV
jgi:hypothetical protein